MSKQFKELKTKQKELESQREKDIRYIQHLEDKVESLERQMFSTKIEISNVPPKQQETKDDLCTIVTNAANAIGHPLQSNEIKDFYRTNNRIKNIVTVDFITIITKEYFLKRTRTFNNANKQNKLSTLHLNIEGNNTPIYVSEKLTPKK